MLTHVLVVGLEAEGEKDTWGAKLGHYKTTNSTISGTLLKLKQAWDTMKQTTLVNAQKCLITFNSEVGWINLPVEDPLPNEENNFQSIDIANLHSLFTTGGQQKVTMDDITDWLDLDSYDPGNGVHTDEEIFANIKMAWEDAAPSPEIYSDKDDAEAVPRKNLLQVK